MPALAPSMNAHATDLDSDVRPLRRASVRTHLVRDEAVLTGGRKRDLVALNATARAVWERCDGEATLAEISADLAAIYEADPGDIRRGVEAILTDLRDRRLVHLQHPDADAAAPRPVTARVSFGHHYVEIYSEATRLGGWIQRIMGELVNDTGTLFAGRVEAYPHGRGYQVRDHRGHEEVFAKSGDAVTWLKRSIVTRFVRARPDLLWFHGGAVARGGQALLCVGQGGSGKSTLLTALYKEGWKYFSDDVQPYDPASGCVLPFPLRPVFRVGGNEIVDEAALSSLKRSRVPLDPSGVAAEPLPVRLLAFPAFHPHGTGTVAEHSPSSAAVKLSRHCLNLQHHWTDPAPALCDLADHASAFDVLHNERSPARDLLLPHVPW